MHLKSLRVFGFKSFADRTKFDFAPGVTCVVGPNGCGKSNVVDATKWVLGEQSVKSLRGKNMTDVIFNGSEKRKPLNFSDVELVFDNKSRRLSLDYDDISVRRKLFRDGSSEYYINGQRALLRQVRELFMDTGIGTSTYSMIEQGRISAFLAASAKDRRAVFEEAAGISRYKVSLKRARKSLERVQTNLDRLDDVVGEVRQNLAKVERQASKARRYRAIQDELKDNRLLIALYDYKHLSESHLAVKEALDAAIESERSLEAEFSIIQSQVVEKETAGEEIERELMISANTLNASREDLARLETEMTYQRQRIIELAAQRDAAERIAAETDAKREAMRYDADAALDACADLVIRNEIAGRTVAGLQSKLQRNRETLGELTEARDALRTEAFAAAKKREDIKNRLIEVETNYRVSESERQRVRIELARAVSRASSSDADVRSLSALRHSLEAKCALAEKSRILTNAFSLAFDERARVLSSVRDSALRERDNSRARQKMLTQSIERHEGMAGGVRAILDAAATPAGQRFEIVGVIADLIRVKPGLELAIENALGAKLQNVVSRSVAGVRAAIDFLKRDRLGRVTFLPMDRIQARSSNYGRLLDSPGCVGLGSDLVSHSPELSVVVQSLLGGTIVFDTFDSAVSATRASGQNGALIVTLDGEIFYPGGAIAGGDGKQYSVRFLNRQNDIDALEETIRSCSAEVESIDAQTAIDHTRRAALRAEQTRLDALIKTTGTEAVRATESLRTAWQASEAARRDASVLSTDMQRVDAALDASRTDADALKRTIETQDTDSRDIDERIAALTSRIEAIRQSHTAEDTELTELRLEETRIVEQLKSSRDSYFRLLKALDDQAALFTARLTERDRLEAERSQTSAAIEAGQTALIQRINDRDALERSQNEKSELRNQLRNEINTLRGDERLLRERLSGASHALTDARENESAQRMQIDALIDRARVQLSADIIEIYAERGAPETVSDTIRADVEALERKLDSLGAVSMYAIEEYDELSKRHEFLAAQQSDLTRARDRLRTIIATINRKSRTLFIETFDKVKANFQVMFRKLFNGGMADVLMEDNEDVLEAGINVIARPPGKEPKHIDALSGGEQAMTTLALIFSIYQLKPAPFCILDEVDAPLDEGNVDRFNLVVREFLDHSQFIIITHNKKTMSYADTIYGVTMQEKGVSRKIAINFNDLEEQEEALLANG
ncbi:MAG: chromosome segregation protein SMC [Planctomycetota bacterium]